MYIIVDGYMARYNFQRCETLISVQLVLTMHERVRVYANEMEM